MAGKAGGYRGGVESALADFIELLGKAVLSGIAASLLLGLVALGLASTAQAQTRPNDAKTGTLLFRLGSDGAFAPAPKVETDVVIHVTGMVARTRVAQTFVNPGTDFVEGLYVFPLPENAALDRLWLRIGSRVIEGQVKEKAEAARVYVQAKREGRKAALVEQQRPNLFTNAVANIGPGETVRVLIEYQQALRYEDGEYRLRFPLAVTPRYQPAAESAQDAVMKVSHAAYAPAGGGVNPVAIGVVIDSGVPLAKVESSYHEAVVEKESGTRTILTLRKEQEEADRDFELVFAPQPGSTPQAAAFTESRGGRDYTLLMVMPPAPAANAAAPLPRETVFVIDTSGSMQGTSMAQAKEALLTGLSTLTAQDRFNVVEFNSATRPMWPSALPATGANLEHARAWVARLRADGGTEMAGALAFALDGRDTPGYLRQGIFMTDGSVGNEDQLFRLIADRLGATRLFTVGIGSAPNSHFMTKAALFGRGTFTWIGDLREVQDKMARLFAKIGSPVLKDDMLVKLVSEQTQDHIKAIAQRDSVSPRVSDAIGIPIMVQDAPASGTVLSAPLLARMAREIEQVSYFKIETAGAASKLRELIRLGGDAIEGPWDGEEAITLLPDLDAGATGSMTGGGFPDGLRPILDAYFAGRREEAIEGYTRWLPLINIENRQCGFLAAKALMKEGGIIACDAPRHPWPPLHPESRKMLLEAARRLDVLALRWGR